RVPRRRVVVAGCAVLVAAGFTADYLWRSDTSGGAVAAAVNPHGTDRYGDTLPEGAVARMGTVRFRHAGTIGGIAYSPDGKTLASVSFAPGAGEKVRLWDLATGRERQCLENSVAAAFSPDGKTLAVGTTDGVVQLWNDSTSREICRFPAKRETRIERLLFARD